ncbi:interleukin-27 receptor subunit alpha [Pelobates cultripes]|nr:interleukin-27 receptor subunit alpha [Pelobates cultripes]
MTHWCWLRAVGVFLLLFVGDLGGNSEVCSLCCIFLREDRGLNCTWAGNANTQYTLHLQSLKFNINKPSTVLNFTSLLGRTSILIPRKSLTKNDNYLLKLKHGAEEESYYFTYDDADKNLLIEPPLLSDVMFSGESDVSAHISWPIPSDNLHVAIRYQNLADTNSKEWIYADPSDIQHDNYEISDLEPFSQYDVQARYESNNTLRSLWSESRTFWTPEQAPVGPLDVWRNFDMKQFVILYWKPQHCQYPGSDKWNYIVTYIHGGGSNALKTPYREPLCEVKLPANSTHMCVSAQNNNGTGPPTCATTVCLDTKPLDVEIRVWLNVTQGVTVWWDESLNERCEDLTYLVEWTQLTEGGSKMKNWARRQVGKQNVTLPGKLDPQVPYQVSLFTLCQSDCKGPVSTIMFYSQEGVPSSAPNFSVLPLSSTDIFISWNEIPVWKQKGFITSYTVYLNSTVDSQRHPVSARNLSISGLLPSTVYEIWVTASTAAGEGTRGEVKVFHTKGSVRLAVILLPIHITLVMFGFLIFIYVQRKRGKMCWIQIPNPENSRSVAKLFNTKYSNPWDTIQTPSNPPVTVVEEVNLPPQLLTPLMNGHHSPITVDEDLLSPATSPTANCNSRFQIEDLPSGSPPATINKPTKFGYEKHFMPTIEEVMGLC